MKLKALAFAGLAFAKKHEGTILTAGSMISTGLAVFFALRDAPKIMAKFDEIREKDLTTLEKAKEIAPVVARVGLATGASFIFQAANHKYAANAVSSAANAIGLYNMASKELELKDKAIAEIAGEDTVKAVNNKVAEEKEAATTGVGYSECPTRKIIYTGEGTELFHDVLTGQWFYSSYGSVGKHLYNLNRAALVNDICADEYAWELGIKNPPPTIEGLFWRSAERTCSAKDGFIIDPDIVAKNDGSIMYWEISFDEYAMPKRGEDW